MGLFINKKNSMFCNKEKFIEKARKIHGDKYDYSKVEYIDYLTPICIICPLHGEFWQTPNTHLCGGGCQICGKEKQIAAHRKLKRTTEDFVKEAEEKYGNKYDYSQAIYKGARTKLTIIDKSTGRKFEITPDSFLNRNFKNQRELNLSTEDWIKRAKKIHGDKYDYSITEYKGTQQKIKYICPKHGVIEQLPTNHLKYGCRKCSFEEYGKSKTKTTEDFINDAIKIHGNKYDYSKVEYKGNHDKVIIICPKHGEFYQEPAKHLSGHGCPKCKTSRLEEKVLVYLKEKNIDYIYQYAPSFLKNGRGIQKLDFFLPQYNIGIECQGIQHFVPSRYMGKEKVDKNKQRDIIKAEKCKNNGILLLYYMNEDNIEYVDFSSIYTTQNVFTDLGKIIDFIEHNRGDYI